MTTYSMDGCHKYLVSYMLGISTTPIAMTTYRQSEGDWPCHDCMGEGGHYPDCIRVPIIAAYGYGPWPGTPPSESVPLLELVGKRGRLKHSGLPYSVIEAHPTEEKVRIAIVRVKSEWLTKEELMNASEGGDFEPA